MPQPFAQKNLNTIHFNKYITDDEFQKEYHLQGSNFMHTYHLINKKTIDAFNSIKVEDKWVAIHKNNFYAMVSKEMRVYDINSINNSEEWEIKDFNQLKCICRQINLFLGIFEPFED